MNILKAFFVVGYAAFVAVCIAVAVCGCTITLPELPDIPDNLPPAITNALPTLPPVVTPPAQPADGSCACDHSFPLCPDDIRTVYDRVHGEGSHKAAGNREVCNSAQSGAGYDIRCLFRWAGPRQRHVSSWGERWGYKVISRGILDALCFRATLAGWIYQFHWLGWSTEEDQKIQHPNDRRIICKGRTFGFWEVRVIGRVDTPPPVVVPPVAPPDPVADVLVPPRTGTPSYSGNGTSGTFLEVPGSATRNPAKSVSMQTWVRLNGWPRADEGCAVINKGAVGQTWAYALKIRPGALLYQQTKGTVYASHKWRTGEWHHVRCDADKNGVRFWVDGKSIAVTSSEVTTYLGSNEQPIRIGGQWMHWEPSAWFNASIDGTVSDWEVVVK